MKQKDTVEGVSRKLNVFELNGKTFFKGLGAKLSIAIAGVLAVGAVSITALADYEGIAASDANTNASTTTTRNNQSEATTASATMSWWKAGVSEYDLTQTEEITELVTTVKEASSDKATTVKERKTVKETATVATRTKNSAAAKEKKAAQKVNKNTKSKVVNTTATTVIDVLYVQEDVKLRKEPDTSSDVIKIVKQGDKVNVTGEEVNGFYPVKAGKNSGYIMTSYLGSKPSNVTTTNESVSKESLGIYKITAYTAKSTARTASGTKCKAGRTIAAPSRFAFGTKLMFNGNVYTVEDRGGAIVNNILDLYVDTESEAIQWGVRYMEVYKVKN